VAAGRLDGTIEIQGDASQAETLQSPKNHLPQQPPEILNAFHRGFLEHTAKRGYVWETIETKHAFDQRIVAIMTTLFQLAISQEEMHDELQEDDGSVVDLSIFRATETGPELFFEIQHRKELLKDYQTGKRRE
jgi:hypothetical protein